MKIAMLVPGLRPHDAVSNDVRGMTAVLRGDGHEVAVFAPHAQGVDEVVRAPEELSAWFDHRDGVLVYHYCVGWDLALNAMRKTRARRVLRYHNITPPEFFADWSPGYVSACEGGRRQLDDFAALGCDLYLGDSPYNNEDFISRGIGTERCEVLAPFHEIEHLLDLPAKSERIPQGSPLWLAVGRISPNKSYLELVDAFAASFPAARGDAPHLLIIGKLDPNLARYGEALQARIAAHGLEQHITILQDANGAELRAAFEHATAFVMLSRHEGFCVPLVEAMALGTPIVALASSAMPSTIGDAGIVWDCDEPHLIATTVARIGADAQLRSTLRERGRARYANTFANPVLGQRLRLIMQRFASP